MDCMTKLHGNAARMLQLMRTATYKLVVEKEALVRRKEYREETGRRNPRPSRASETSGPYTRSSVGRNYASSPHSQSAAFTCFFQFSITSQRGARIGEPVGDPCATV